MKSAEYIQKRKKNTKSYFHLSFQQIGFMNNVGRCRLANFEADSAACRFEALLPFGFLVLGVDAFHRMESEYP